MADTNSFPSNTLRPRAGFDLVARILQRPFDRSIRRAPVGSISIRLPNGQHIEHKGPVSGPHAELVIRRWRAIWRLFVAGDIGLAEACLDGDWWTPDLFAVLDFGLRNENYLGTSTGGSFPRRWLNRARHLLRRNNRRGSRRNIAAHYDMGNSFYSHWLDKTMNYSSAIYRRPDQTLEEAQDAKIDRVVELLGIDGGERVLELGFGWGAVAERLAPRCAVTGLTLSREQLAYANRRVAQGGADLRLQDYRDIDGSFDRVVSIEMFEAVGEQYWATYFEKLRAVLTPGGVAVLQIISIEERRFEGYRRTPDFIQKYIFPGGMLPTIPIVERLIARAGLRLESIEQFGDSYAATLAEWQRRFQKAWPAIQDLGFDRRFKRLWEYYLAYCQVGFANRALDVALYKVVKPDRQPGHLQ